MLTASKQTGNTGVTSPSAGIFKIGRLPPSQCIRQHLHKLLNFTFSFTDHALWTLLLEQLLQALTLHTRLLCLACLDLSRGFRSRKPLAIMLPNPIPIADRLYLRCRLSHSNHRLQLVVWLSTVRQRWLHCPLPMSSLPQMSESERPLLHSAPPFCKSVKHLVYTFLG